jgi:tRNA pseudouridine-54 N-methylase
MKITGLWDKELRSLVEIDRRFRSVYCLHDQGDDVESVRTSEMPFFFNETTRRYVAEACHV